MKKMLLNAAALSVAITVASASAATIPYTTDFADSGSAFASESTDAQWAVAGGNYVNTVTAATATTSTAATMLDNAPATPSFVVSSAFQINSFTTVGSNQSHTVGFGAFANSATFASTGGSSYYLADWTFASSAAAQPVGQLRLLALGDTSGVTSTNGLAVPVAGIQTNTAYNLRLTSNLVDSTLTLSLGLYDADGNQIGTTATLTDTSPLAGTNFGFRDRFGLATGGSATVSFDNFTASVPEPTLLSVVGLAGLSLLRRSRKRA